MIRVHTFVMAFVIGILIILVLGKNTKIITYVSRLIILSMGINRIHIHGKHDPTARILLFNHPLAYDGILLSTIHTNINGLMRTPRRYDVFGKFVANTFDFVTVGQSGGENTRDRIINSIKKHKDKQMLVAVNSPDFTNANECGGRGKSNDTIHTFKSIGCSVQQEVQPIVILYPEYYNGPRTHIDMINIMKNQPITQNQEVHICYLPKDKQLPHETVQQFAKRCKSRMNRVLSFMCRTDLSKLTPQTIDIPLYYHYACFIPYIILILVIILYKQKRYTSENR